MRAASVQLSVALCVIALLPSPSHAEEMDEPRTSIWAQPLFSLGARGVALGGHGRIGQVELMVELTAMSQTIELYDAGLYSAGLWGSVGPVIRLQERSRGWFITPKLLGGVLEGEVLAMDGSRRPFVRGVFAHLGVDFGYEWRWGPLMAAVVTGASLGYGFDVTPGLFFPVSTTTGPYDWIPTRKGEGISYGINANLLRVGVTF